MTKIRTRTLIERLKRSLDVLQGDALAIVEAGRDNPAELAMAVNSRDPRKTRTAITAWSLIGPRWAAQTPSRLQARLPEGSPERRTLGRTTAETLRNAMYRETRITTAGRGGKFTGQTAGGTCIDASFRRRSLERCFKDHEIDEYLRNHARLWEEQGVIATTKKACRAWAKARTVHEGSHRIPKLRPKGHQEATGERGFEPEIAGWSTGLLPEEHFDNEPAAAECYYDESSDWPTPAAEGRGNKSHALLDLIIARCRRWTDPPSTEELHDAFKAERPTQRQLRLLRTWVVEANISQLVEGWAQQAYTVRELVRAIHGTGYTRTDGPKIKRRVRLINAWATH